MEIQRIDTYADSRFSECALFQHGCFLVEGRPYEIEIISDFEAVVRGEEKEVYLKIIEEFRFYAPHITKFYNSRGNIVKEYLTVSVKMEEREIKKPSKRDEEIQKYLEETVGLIKGMNENEMKNRVVQKVDEIFKQEEIKKEKDEQAKENNDIQKEKI